jgi:PBSX family phage terminase large subunit
MTIAATRRIELRGAARRLLSCRDSEIVVSGPAGTGKSVGGLTKLHLAAMKYKGFRGLLLRKTAASLGASTLEVWRKHVAVASLGVGDVEYYGGSTAEPPQYRYRRNGSAIVIGGMDKPSKIMSSAYDIAVLDEGTEFFVQDWEAVTTRLRAGNMPYSQAILMCNPDAEHHWIYQRAQADGMTMLESRHEDNPAYFDNAGELTPAGAAYLAKLDRLTGVRYQRLRKGLWVAAEGLIYEDWNPAIHLVDALPPGSEDWVRWWSVDFGHTNPFVLQCWAEDGDGRLWLYREIYMTKRLVEDHARQILRIVCPDGQWIEPRPRAIICDHDAEDRATLERHLGMSTVAANKAVSPGIQAFQARLRKADDGRPRVYVVRDSLVERDPALAEAGLPTCFVEEITGYVWAKGLDGKPAKEQPEKKNDHAQDAARYLGAERDLGGRPGMRALRRY